jgi:hypothetical protein
MTLWAALLRSSQRLLPIVIAAVVLLGARTASAAVPMCSDDGRTVAAPPIGMPVNDRVLKYDAPCPELVRLLLDAPLHDSHKPRPVAERVDDAPRGVLVRVPSLVAPAGVRVLVDFDRPIAVRGVTASIDRPPRR